MERIRAEWLTAPATQAVFAMLTAAGHEAYAVGGCVRNALLNEPVNDIDIATDAHPERVQALAEAAGLKSIPTGIAHGTLTVLSSGVPYEVTTYRRDVSTDGRRATVDYATDVREDARRRDFTMNALYCDATGAVLDPLGGMDDLRARRIRFIEDAATRIREDYLRILRYFRFNAWYGRPEAGLDEEALAAIAGALDGLDTLSRERIGQETLKLLAAPDPAPSVAVMRQLGALARILPGADDSALARLIAEEERLSVAPSALRRLSLLGGAEIKARLRLSRKQAEYVAALRDGLGSAEMPGALGYYHGAEAGRDIVLLRAALFEAPATAEALKAAAFGAAQVFPLRAEDFLPAVTGPALGRHLKALEKEWIASGFCLSAQELRSRPLP